MGTILSARDRAVHILKTHTSIDHGQADALVDALIEASHEAEEPLSEADRQAIAISRKYFAEAGEGLSLEQATAEILGKKPSKRGSR